MIASTSPMYTVFWARLFLKEPVLKIDLLNFVMIFCGIVLIARPPFLFGMTDLYSNDPNVVWAILALIVHSLFFSSNLFVMLRLLKGMCSLTNFLVYDLAQDVKFCFLLDLHWSISISIMGLIGFLCTIILAPITGSVCLPTTLMERLYVILSNGLLFFAHIGKVWIAKVENASFSTLLSRAFDIILTFLAQFLFFEVFY